MIMDQADHVGVKHGNTVASVKSFGLRDFNGLHRASRIVYHDLMNCTS